MPVRRLFGGLGLLIDANSSRIKGESEIDVEGFRKLVLRKGPILRPRVFTGCEIRLSGLLRPIFTLIEISNINDKRILVGT